MKSLTLRQKTFVDAYLRFGNGTTAARLAGYNATYGSLRAIASQNLKKPHIRCFINQAHNAVYQTAQRYMMERLGTYKT